MLWGCNVIWVVGINPYLTPHLRWIVNTNEF